MNLISAWHRFIVKHFIAANTVLLLFAISLLFDLKGLSFDGAWLSLFSEDDPGYREYRQLVPQEGPASSIFIKLPGLPASRLRGLTGEIGRLEGVSAVKAIDFDTAAGNRWLEAVIESAPRFSPGQRDAVVGSIERYLRDSHTEYGITGAIPILEEFTESVRTDFIRTSLIALALIIFVIIYFFGFSPSVVFGFIYQGIGLAAAVSAFRLIYGSLNSLAAMLPCVLIGLGVDFVIHSIIAVDGAARKNVGLPGEIIYRSVMAPVFWGALTTALAFLSLLLADLEGLHSAGILGGLSIAGMFLSVMLFLPAAVTYFHDRDRFRRIGARITFPFIDNRKRPGAFIVIALCALLSFFIGKVRFEERVENLYDRDMPSLRLQDELSGGLGVYPSRVYISFETQDPERDLRRLRRQEEVFLPDPDSLKIDTLKNSGYRVRLQILPRENPFAPGNMERLDSRLRGLFGPRVKETLRISGDAPLYRRLNDLLLKGMAMAFFALFLVLAFVFLVFFKSARFALASLAVLFIATLATLGGFGSLSISLSAYTITLFPLFLGIGVDDCLHVVYLKMRGGRLASGSYVLKAVTLTTITTVLCYGSLITAKNAGFNSAGKAAVLGLTLMFLCAVYLLPVLLEPGLNIVKRRRA